PVDGVLADGGKPDRAERGEAAEWLRGSLMDKGGQAPAKDVKKADAADDISLRTLERARVKAGVVSERAGFGKGAVWRIEALTTGTPSDPASPFPPHSRHSRHGSGGGRQGGHGVAAGEG